MRIRKKFLAMAVAAGVLLGVTGVMTGDAGAVPSGGRAVPASAAPTSAECVRKYGVACYSPQQMQRAYGLTSMYGRGFTGKGRTIVVVDPYGSPTVQHDLNVFDSAFGLPAPPGFRTLQPVGKVPPFDPKNAEMANKAGETTGDVEWAHAMAPGANILLVETPVDESLSGGGFAQFMAAENYVITHDLGDVISQSFSLPEENFPSRSALLGLRYAYADAYRNKVTVLAASNDLGPAGPDPKGTPYDHRVVYWPASDPLVTGVGGTDVRLDADGDRTTPDTAWNESGDSTVQRMFGALPWAGGGGVSAVFPRPAYQAAVRDAVGGARGVPDVSLDSSFSGGVAVYESFTGGAGIWSPGGGTSAATPEFAGIVAIADQYAHRRLGLINPALYRLQRAHAPGLVDVTRGDTTVSAQVNGKTVTLQGYQAVPGYDLATGLGTVDAARLVPELAAAGRRR